MAQSPGGVAYAGLIQEHELGDSTREARPSCPLAIIFRGVSVLSILVGGLGYALAHLSPVSAIAPMKAASPMFSRAPAQLAKWTPPTLAGLKGSFLTNPPAAAVAPQNEQVRSSFLSFLQTALDSRKEVLQFGPMRVKRDIVQTIIRAAKETDTDPVLLMAIADKESSFSARVEARTSSAMGLFQFVDSTWLKVIRDFGARHGLAREASEIVGPEDRPVVVSPGERERILNLRANPYISAVLAAELLKQNGEKIAERIGRGLTGGETYLAHFLGPDDAERFMEKVVGQPQMTAAALLPRPARANASIFYARAGRRARGLSVAAVHEKFEEMMGLRLDRYKSVGADVGLSDFAAGDSTAP